ncbi:MAG: DMT family transporter [Bacillota bacterium]|nr:DMT family transporter [Bacillota bacterium]
MSLSIKQKKAFAVISILCTTAIWGFSFVIMKNSMEILSPLWFLACRFSLASLIMLLLNLPRLKGLSLVNLRDAFWIGLPLAFGYAMQTLGLNITTASNSAFITGIYVVFIPLISWFFTKKLKAWQLLVAFLAFVGLAALSLDANLHINRGDLLVLAGALGYAAHFLVLDHYTKLYDSLLISALQIFTCTLLLILAALLFEPLPTADQFPPSVLHSLLFTAALGTGLGFLVQTAAQKVLEPTPASILFTSETLFAAFFGTVLLNERFIPRQIMGGIILIACMIASVVEKKPGSAAEKLPAAEERPSGEAAPAKTDA